VAKVHFLPGNNKNKPTAEQIINEKKEFLIRTHEREE
jgi:hypothetical protein